MKKTIFGLMALCAVSLGFVSCGSDDIDLNRGTHSEQPQNAKQGTFVGTMSIYEGSLDKLVSSKTDENATVTITPGEGAYTAKIVVNSPKNADASGCCVVNVVWKGDDIQFFTSNVVADEKDKESIRYGVNKDINVAVTGYTVGERLHVSYAKTVKSGRTTNTFFYKFDGRFNAAE